MIDEDEHKERFKLVADLFSKRKAQEFEQVIQRNVCAPESILCCFMTK